MSESLDAALGALSHCDPCDHAPEGATLVGMLRQAGAALRKARADLRRTTMEARELERIAEEDQERIGKLERLHKAAALELDAALAARDDLVKRQSDSIRALKAPILEVSGGVLAVPIIGALDDTRAAEIMSDLLAAVVSRGAPAVALDLTGVVSLDAGTASHIAALCKALALVGARVVVSGLRPDVVRGIVEAGVDLGTITTVRSLKDAIERARKR